MWSNYLFLVNAYDAWPISFRVATQALLWLNDYVGASEVTLKNLGEMKKWTTTEPQQNQYYTMTKHS